MHEDLDEDLDQLEEALVVDIKPTKRGWAGRPDSDLELAEEELLALEQDSEYREKMAAMRKAVNNLEGVNEGLTQENETLKQQLNEVKAQMSKIRNVANTLKENIDQTNLTNAKLLYQNKALKSDSMNERQKNKLVEALNNAETVEEAKVIFDTLENTVGSTSRKSQPKSLVEAVEKSSSIVYASRKQRIAEQKQTPAYDRWKFLAGIDKN
jgi:chromosome segregation ATPase